MKVKDVIIRAFRLAGREDLSAALSGGESFEEGGEAAHAVNAMLYCYNAVEDELARNYFPLPSSAELSSSSGKYYYRTFPKTPVRIKSVTENGSPAQYGLFPEYLASESRKICVEYDYSPDKKTIDDDCEYGDPKMGEALFALGCAAEYCLINGEMQASESWECRYREEIDAARARMPRYAYMPPRRWV